MVNNKAYLEGGAIYVDYGAKLSIARTNFTKNQSMEKGGGAILVRGEATLSGSRFLQNDSRTVRFTASSSLFCKFDLTILIVVFAVWRGYFCFRRANFQHQCICIHIRHRVFLEYWACKSPAFLSANESFSFSTLSLSLPRIVIHNTTLVWRRSRCF